MKKVALLFIVTAVFVAVCSNSTAQNKQYIVISGTIQNPNSDSVFLRNSSYQTIDTFLLTDGRFSDTLLLEEGRYFLADNKEQTSIYLLPGGTLHLSLNTEEFDESIQYTGSLAAENNYLAQKMLLREKFGMKAYYGYYAKLDEATFLRESDSLFQQQTDLLLQFKPNIHSGFFNAEWNELTFNYLIKLHQFEPMKQFVTGDTGFAVSDSFPNVFSHVDVSDEDLLKSPSYVRYVLNYIRTLKPQQNNPDQDYFLAILDIIDSVIENRAIKNQVIFESANSGIEYTGHLDEYYNQVTATLTDSSLIRQITDKYNKLKKIAKGATSPDFKLQDINGKTYTLNDFRGKYVYIDVWATWCLPCIKEIPHLKELEKEYPDIEFVSICTIDSPERWKKKIEDEELGGIQLFAPEDIEFLTTFMVTGVPRFILIDPEGKIYDSKAPRPSSSEIRGVLDSLK